jgi:uncharacterized protein with GYD domain
MLEQSKGSAMPKYLIQAQYTSDGLKRLMQDTAAGRTADLRKAVASVGGTLDALYWALGEDDAILIVDLPDAVAAAAAGIASSASGHARTRTTRLLTAGEVDTALEKIVRYRDQKNKK